MGLRRPRSRSEMYCCENPDTVSVALLRHSARAAQPAYVFSHQSAHVHAVRRHNVWRRSRLRLAEDRPRLGVDVRRRACGAASAPRRLPVWLSKTTGTVLPGGSGSQRRTTYCASDARSEARSLARRRTCRAAGIAVDGRAYFAIGLARRDKLALAPAAQRPDERGETGHQSGQGGDEDGIKSKYGRLRAEIAYNHIGTMWENKKCVSGSRIR